MATGKSYNFPGNFYDEGGGGEAGEFLDANKPHAENVK
jgi:hypothetical protein